MSEIPTELAVPQIGQLQQRISELEAQLGAAMKDLADEQEANDELGAQNAQMQSALEKWASWYDSSVSFPASACYRATMAALSANPSLYLAAQVKPLVDALERIEKYYYPSAFAGKQAIEALAYARSKWPQLFEKGETK